MKDIKKQKLELFEVKKGMSLEEIRKNLRTFLTNQGLVIKPNDSTEEVDIKKCGWPAGTSNLYDDDYLK